MTVRPPAVAGTFYPGQAATLAAEVERCLAQAAPPAPGAPHPRAIVAPHAGYVYSGPVAGSAYAPLRARAGEIHRVVVLGPAHRVPLRGIAASQAGAFRTPLGEVAVDQRARDALAAEGLIGLDDRAHRDEHSVEVQLPFLQTLFPGVPALPLVAGRATADEVARLLDRLWAEDTLIVVSSDLSHYLSYAQAQERDRRTAAAIEALDPEGLDEDSACGRVPVTGLLVAARHRGLVARTVDLRNSGDTAGPPDQVVGYGAFLFG